MCIGGPALIYYVTPTEEELFLVSLAASEASKTSKASIQAQEFFVNNY